MNKSSYILIEALFDHLGQLNEGFLKALSAARAVNKEFKCDIVIINVVNRKHLDVYYTEAQLAKKVADNIGADMVNGLKFISSDTNSMLAKKVHSIYGYKNSPVLSHIESVNAQGWF